MSTPTATPTVSALNVRIDSALHDWLRAKAAEDRRSLRLTLEIILEDAMRQDGGEAA